MTYSAKQRREFYIFEVLTTTRAHCGSKSFILCLHMKIIRVKQTKVHFDYFVQLHGIIVKQFKEKFYFIVSFSLQHATVDAAAS